MLTVYYTEQKPGRPGNEARVALLSYFHICCLSCSTLSYQKKYLSAFHSIVAVIVVDYMYNYTAHIFRDILGKQALFSWWHGKGGLVDYSNEDAKNWWHGQLDKVLSLGIDGWKCDGTDPYILELVIPLGKHGVITRREYSDAYYADFFDYTRQKLGNDRLIMSRPVDGLGVHSNTNYCV